MTKKPLATIFLQWLMKRLFCHVKICFFLVFLEKVLTIFYNCIKLKLESVPLLYNILLIMCHAFFQALFLTT